MSGLLAVPPLAAVAPLAFPIPRFFGQRPAKKHSYVRSATLVLALPVVVPLLRSDYLPLSCASSLEALASVELGYADRGRDDLPDCFLLLE